jgi:tubulin--tyrosine ligase
MGKVCLHKTSKFYVLGLEGEKHHDESGNRLSVQLKKPQNRPAGNRLSVFLDVDEPYTRNMIEAAFSERSHLFSVELGPGQGMEEVPMPPTCDFQWAEYERIDWSSVLAGKHGASSFCVRKGLSRKAQLAFYTHRHVCKHPDSILKTCIPKTLILDTWPVWEDDVNHTEGLADIVVGSCTNSQTNRRGVLDQCLSEARTKMKEADDKYASNPDCNAEPLWILKPSTTNKGAGIQIVDIYEQLVDLVWSEPDIREW